MSLAAVGRFEEAAEAGVRATRLDPDGLENWELYWNAMREAGHAEESAEGRRMAELLRNVRPRKPH